MSLALLPEAPPLVADELGCIRVGGTRISLDVVIADFEAGLTPRDIAERYDVLHLADVFGAITYYLRHRVEVDAYLRRRTVEAMEIRAKVERDLKPGPRLSRPRERMAARNVAKLVNSEPQARRPRQAGSAKGMLVILQEDDEHLKDFEEYFK
jgi:uncharacterized protein (DUF433 family)